MGWLIAGLVVLLLAGAAGAFLAARAANGAVDVSLSRVLSYGLVGGVKSVDTDKWDGLAIRTGPAGEKVWSRTLGSDEHDCLYGAIEVSDRGFLLGAAEDFGVDTPGNTEEEYSVWLARTDAEGRVTELEPGTTPP